MSLAFDTSVAIQSADRGVTARAVLLGLVLVCAEVAVITFSEPVARSSSMNVSHFPVGFFMWFVVVVLGLNPLLKWIYPGYMLSRSELLTVAVMGLIGAHIPGSGLLGFFLGGAGCAVLFCLARESMGSPVASDYPFVVGAFE